MAIYQLSWNRPTTRTDGTELPEDQIAGYIVRRVFNGVTSEFDTITTSYLLDIGADAGVGTLTVAAVDIVGATSSFVPVPTVVLYNNPPTFTTRLYSISSRIFASDADLDSLTFSVQTQGTKGVASITNNSTGEIKYTPTAGQTGTDTFQIKVSDARTGGDVFQNFSVDITNWSITNEFESISISRA